MTDTNEGSEKRSDYAGRSGIGRGRSEFRPMEIEATHELDLSGLNHEEAEGLRQRAFGVKQADAIVNSVLGLTSEAARTRFLRVLWGKWGQFPQVIKAVTVGSDNAGGRSQDVLKETLTRIYQVDARGDD
jgi:hypothetical protein